MNLHQIVSGNIAAVNPFVTGAIRISTGYTTDDAGERTPTYAPDVNASMQVQPLSAGELQHLDGLNIQGTRRAIYINGRLDGLVRPLQKGGDIIFLADDPNAGEWLVVLVSEQWPDWCRVAVLLQNP